MRMSRCSDLSGTRKREVEEGCYDDDDENREANAVVVLLSCSLSLPASYAVDWSAGGKERWIRGVNGRECSIRTCS